MKSKGPLKKLVLEEEVHDTEKKLQEYCKLNDLDPEQFKKECVSFAVPKEYHGKKDDEKIGVESLKINKNV